MLKSKINYKKLLISCRTHKAGLFDSLYCLALKKQPTVRTIAKLNKEDFSVSDFSVNKKTYRTLKRLFVWYNVRHSKEHLDMVLQSLPFAFLCNAPRVNDNVPDNEIWFERDKE